MIKLARRRGNAVPAAFRPPKTTTAAHKLIDIFYAGQPPNKYVFESSAWKPAKTALKKDSAGKCAYCEAPTDSVAHGDVEHFRPKSDYWWLALCFDNYLYSCQICNQSFKSDNFPIGGVKAPEAPMPAAKPQGNALDALAASLVIDASTLTDAQIAALWAAEDADIIHPYFEDPEPLLRYEVDDANREIWIRSAGGARADRVTAAAEQFLGLNREELRRARHFFYRPFATLKATLDAAIPASLRVIVAEELRRSQASDEPFAGMRRFFASEWGLPGPT